MRFAIAYISFLDNDLQVVVTEGGNWREALANTFGEDKVEYLPPEHSLVECKLEALSQNWAFDVFEVPES